MQCRRSKVACLPAGHRGSATGDHLSTRRDLSAGQLLYRQGEPSDCAWLVERGAVELVSHQGRRAIHHGIRGPGELIGELGMLDGAPRVATATARVDTVLLAIEHDQLMERLQGGDPIVRTLVDSLLRQTRSIIASLPFDSVPFELAAPSQATVETDEGQHNGIDKIRLEAQLRDALDSGSLDVHYQPILDIQSGHISGYEALVRWQLPDRGMISPTEFIRLAEETSLIVPVGEYVLDRAVAVLTGLRDAGVAPLPDIAVNVSARQLLEPGMARDLIARLRQASLPAGVLKLEITESRMLEYAPVAAVMRHCRAHGVRFSLDDFGTGYSNLTHLARLDFEFIKIDQAFARQMLKSTRSLALVDAIMALARAVGAEVICEGIETGAQMQHLRKLGVRYAQGYLVGRAQTAGSLLAEPRQQASIGTAN